MEEVRSRAKIHGEFNDISWGSYIIDPSIDRCLDFSYLALNLGDSGVL